MLFFLWFSVHRWLSWVWESSFDWLLCHQHKRLLFVLSREKLKEQSFTQDPLRGVGGVCAHTPVFLTGLQFRAPPVLLLGTCGVRVWRRKAGQEGAQSLLARPLRGRPSWWLATFPLVWALEGAHYSQMGTLDLLFCRPLSELRSCESWIWPHLIWACMGLMVGWVTGATLRLALACLQVFVFYPLQGPQYLLFLNLPFASVIAHVS